MCTFASIDALGSPFHDFWIDFGAVLGIFFRAKCDAQIDAKIDAEKVMKMYEFCCEKYVFFGQKFIEN